MSKNVFLSDALYDYILSVSLREPEVLKQLREETAALPNAGMQISPEQGQFLGLLVKLTGAKRILEVGVFTGYSSTSFALALPPEGHLTALDVSEPWTTVAKRYWEKSGVTDKVELRLGPALDTLTGLINEGQADTYDLAFIDADKENYDNYYEQALRLLRPGGLLLIDNVLWSGKVTDPDSNDPDTLAIRALNRKIHADTRVSLSLLPVADGLTLVLKH